MIREKINRREKYKKITANMKKKYVYILLALVVVAIVIGTIISKNKAKNAGIEVEMQAASTQNIVQTVAASGKIYPVEEVKISSDVSGEIIELNVKEGDIVEKGQLLARIQAESYQAYVEQSEANLNNAKANEANLQARLKQVEAQLLNTEANFNRTKGLYEKKVLSKADFEQAETAYKSAQAEYAAGKDAIKAAEFTTKAVAASIKDAKNNLNKTAIYAPMSGIVSLLNVEKGEKVVGTLQMTGTEMMRIADFRQMEVRVDVSESEIIKIKIGDTADIQIDAYLDRNFMGMVSEVANTSKGASGDILAADQSTNFVVKILIDRNSYTDLLTQTQKPFLPGMSATVEIKTKRKDNVVAVPIQAVAAKDTLIDGRSVTREIIYVFNNGIAKQRIVKTGIQNDTYIEILEGLKSGETVITGPYNTITKKLTGGEKVVLLKEDKKKKVVEEEEEEE
jgi:HlyD family secretion protein